MTPDCLEKLAAPVIQDNSIEMVIGDYEKNYTEIPHPVRFVVSSSNLMHGTPTELKSNEDIRKWYFHGNRLRPGNVWNKLIKLSFLREHQLYNKEGLLFEDWLWSFYLMRYVTHVAFVHDVTYIYYRRSDSIATKTSREEKLRHHGYIYREMTEQMVIGEHIEETECNLLGFCCSYVDASDNPDYQYAYEAYFQQLSVGKQVGILLLKLAQCASKKKAMRVVYKGAVQGLQQIRRIVGFVSK